MNQPHDEDDGTIFSLGSPSPHPIIIIMQVNGQRVPMELDTGAAVSLMSLSIRRRLFPRCSMVKTPVILTTCTGEQIAVVGKMQVKMRYGSQYASLPLYVVKGDGPNLMGRSWLRAIQLDWRSIQVSLVSDPPLSQYQMPPG